MDYVNQIRMVFDDCLHENYGQAKHRLRVAVEQALAEQKIPDSLLSATFELLRQLIGDRKPDAMRWVIEIAGALGDYYIELLKPFSMVADYLTDGDVTHILRMQVEYRELFLPLLGLGMAKNLKMEGGYIIEKENRG